MSASTTMDQLHPVTSPGRLANPAYRECNYTAYEEEDLEVVLDDTYPERADKDCKEDDKEPCINEEIC